MRSENTVLKILLVLSLFVLASVLWRSGAPKIKIAPIKEIMVPAKEADSSRPPAPDVSAPSAPAKSAPKPTVYRRPLPKTIKIISPVAEEEWVIGEGRAVAWDKAPGSTGELYLLDASQKTAVGWIHSNIGPTQTSYRWDTRDLFPSRSSGLKKPVQTGSYIVRLRIDETGQAIDSGIFRIILPAQVKVATHAVTITHFAYTPNTLTVKKGDSIVFSNNDDVTHRVVSTSFGPLTLKSGESFAFDTSALNLGTYPYYDDGYPSMNATLVVR